MNNPFRENECPLSLLFTKISSEIVSTLMCIPRTYLFNELSLVLTYLDISVALDAGIGSTLKLFSHFKH